MKVEQLINQLRRHYKPDDDLIVDYWDRDNFPEIPRKKWGEFASHVEAKMDRSNDHETIGWMWDDYRSQFQQTNQDDKRDCEAIRDKELSYE